MLKILNQTTIIEIDFRADVKLMVVVWDTFQNGLMAFESFLFLKDALREIRQQRSHSLY